MVVPTDRTGRAWEFYCPTLKPEALIVQPARLRRAAVGMAEIKYRGPKGAGERDVAATGRARAEEGRIEHGGPATA
jgi:hypothetical protein